MIDFHTVDLDLDYATLQSWWATHKVPEAPREILPRGWFAASGGTKLAAAFLYVAEGKIAVLEFMTTNPLLVGLDREKLRAVKELYLFIEQVAKEEGCLGLISFVRPGSFEEHFMAKAGYVSSTPDPGHKLYAKSLTFAHEGGTVKCR